MSSTSSLSSQLNITGLASNTDWQSMVSEINAAQKTAAETPLNNMMTSQQNILSAWQSFNTTLSAVTNYISTNNLNSAAGYQSYTASLTCPTSTTITPSSVLSASIGQGSISPGTYSVEVSGLASAQSISSDPFTSSSTALGLSGDIVINNQTISLASTDTLSGVVTKINGANAGVTASVLKISGTSYRLNLQSNTQGAAGMSLKDGGASNVLESLNLTSGAQLINPSGSNALSDSYSGAQLIHPSGSSALGSSLSDSATAVGTLLGLGSPPSGSVQIQGTDGTWKNVSVDLATDSLTTIANNINAAGATGVTASVVPTSVNGTTTYQLQLTNVAAANLQDQNDVLAKMGVFKSGDTTALGTFLGLGSPPSGSVQIQGTDGTWKNVSVDLATDSLTTIANNINAAGATGVTASVVPTSVNGTTTYQLQLTNVAAANLQDQNNVLATVGILGATAKNIVQPGLDAGLKIDGYSVPATSNTVTGVISGVTLTLKGTNVGNPIQLAITQDNSSISSSVNTLVGNVSSALAFINSQNTYNSSSTSSTANVLMGDANLTAIKKSVVNTLLENIPGNTTYTTAQSIGINFASDGSVSLNADTLAAALSSNPTETMNAVKTLSSDLYKNLSVYVNPITGTIQSIETSTNNQMTSITAQLKSVDDRCAQQAQALSDEYNQLEVLLSQSNSTKTFLTYMENSMTNSSNSTSSTSF